MSVDELSKISSSGSDSSPSTKEVNVFICYCIIKNIVAIQSILISVSSVIVFGFMQNNKCRHWHCTVIV